LIKSEDLKFNVDEELEFLKVLRFLRARKFDIDTTMEMIRDDVKWRSENNRLTLQSQTAFEALNCDLEDVYEYFPTYHMTNKGIQGCDKQSRPIAWRQFGKFEIWNILKLTSMDCIMNFHAWESEQLLKLMHDKSTSMNINVETFTVIVDASGWTMNMSTSNLAFFKGIAAIDGNHYPERLGRCVIINAPRMLAWA
jgi:acetolactate synthase regulatory subunit